MSLRRDVQKLTNSTKWARIQGKFQDGRNEMVTPSGASNKGSSQHTYEDFDNSSVKNNENDAINDSTNLLKKDDSKNSSNGLYSQSEKASSEVTDSFEKPHIENRLHLVDIDTNSNLSDPETSENKPNFAVKSFSEITEECLSLFFGNKSGNKIKIKTTSSQSEDKKNELDSIILDSRQVLNVSVNNSNALSVENGQNTETSQEIAKPCHDESMTNFQRFGVSSQHDKILEDDKQKYVLPDVMQKNSTSHRKNASGTKSSHNSNAVRRRTSRHSCPRTSFRDRGKCFHYPRPQKPKGKVKNLIRKFEEISGDNLQENQNDESLNGSIGQYNVTLGIQALNECYSNSSEKTHCLNIVKNRDDSGISEGEESTSPKHITETINHRLIENYNRSLNETNAKNSEFQDSLIKSFPDCVLKHIYSNYPLRMCRENRRSRSKSPRPKIIVKKPMPLPRSSSQYLHVSDCYSGHPYQQRDLTKKKCENLCPKLSQSEEEWADISEEEKDVISYSQKLANVSKRFYDLKIPIYCSQSANLYDCCSPTRKRWIDNANLNKDDSTGDSSWETVSLHQDEEEEDDKSSTTSSEHHYEAINDFLKHEPGKLSTYRDDQQSPDDFIRESFDFLDTHSADESDDIESPSALSFSSHPLQSNYRYNEKKSNTTKDKLSPSWDSRDSITETVLMYQELSSFRRSFNKKAFKKILKENELERNKLKKQSLFSKNSKEILNFYVPWFSRNDHNQKPEYYESSPEPLNIDSPEIKEKKKGKYFTMPHPKKLSRSEQHLDNLNSPNDLDIPPNFDTTRRASDSSNSKNMELTEGNQTVSSHHESLGNENSLESQSSSPDGSRVSVISCSSCADDDYICRKDLESTPNSSSSEESINCAKMRKPIDVNFIKIRKRVESTGSEHSYFQLSEVSGPLIDNENPSYEQILINQNNNNSVGSEQQNNSVHYCELNSGEFQRLSSEAHMSIEQLSILSQIGEKKLWSDLPEVQKSGVLEKMSAQELKLQEAMFNVAIFEGNYLHLLQTYQQHFVHSSSNSDGHSLCKIMSLHEWRLVFLDFVPIIEINKRLVADIQCRWDEHYLLFDITDILYNNIKTHFHAYVKFCTNKPYRDRMLKVLMATKPKFAEVTRNLEASSEHQGLLLEEFLMLPAHHISDLLVLIEEIYHWLPTNSPKCRIYNEIMDYLCKLKLECEKSALQMERMEEMLLLSQQIIFKAGCKLLSLISVSRWLLKRGEMTHLICDIPNKRTFGKSVRWSKASVYLFLFNDFLIVTKQRNDEKYNVLDYCPKNIVHAEFIDDRNSTSNLRAPSNCKYLLRLTLWSNHNNKTVEMILNCPSESEKIRWGEAFISDAVIDSDVTERQDNINVQCIQAYAAQQADELTLFESDVVKVLRKVGDGWYKGKHMKDGNIGWFLASHVRENIPDFKVNHLSLGHKYSQVPCTSSPKIPLSPK